MRLLGSVGVGSLLVMAIAQPASAAWTAATVPTGAGRSAAATMPSGNQPTGSLTTPAGSTVDVAWPASIGGAPVAGYEVRSYDATTGTPRAVGASCAGIVAGTSCSETDVPDGSWRYTVVPRQQAWAGAESPLSDPVIVDTTPPTVAITFPGAAGAYTTTSWNAGCSSTICGTSADVGSAVSSITVSIRQGAGNYWDGTSFGSVTEVLLPATGTTSWTFAFPATNFPTNGSYTIRAVARDLALNFGETSGTFTFDHTAPTVATTFPAAGGIYNNASWNAGCTSSICGTSADVGSSVASVSVSVRQSAGSYWNGTAFASATEVLLPATGTTSWSRGFPATNFPADGSYTVRAVATDLAGNTTSVSTTFTVDRTSPAPTTLTLFDANGTVTAGTDEVRIAFGEALNVSSVCSAWSGVGDQSLSGSGVVVTITDSGANDIVTVAAGACTLHIGSVATGGDYVLLSSTFSGATPATESRVTWTSATRVLTVHIGAQASGLLNLVSQSAATATYTPDAAITDPAGNGVVTTPFSATVQRF
jgi:hypothetical protein